MSSIKGENVEANAHSFQHKEHAKIAIDTARHAYAPGTNIESNPVKLGRFGSEHLAGSKQLEHDTQGRGN